MAIATLIAAGRLDDRLIDRGLGALREIDPKAAFAAWIDEGDAVDLRVSGDIQTIRWALEGLQDVDVFVQPEENRFKRLLVADMDSTIVGQECLDELADFAGLKREIAEITERAMQESSISRPRCVSAWRCFPVSTRMRSPVASPNASFPTRGRRRSSERCASAERDPFS